MIQSCSSNLLYHQSSSEYAAAANSVKTHKRMNQNDDELSIFNNSSDQSDDQNPPRKKQNFEEQGRMMIKTTDDHSTRGSNTDQSDDDESSGLRLLGLLLKCAESISMDNLDEASDLLPEISQLSSPFGTSPERVASYFGQALQSRIISCCIGLFHILASRSKKKIRSMRITGIGSSMLMLQATGKRLSDFASSLGLPFEFNPLEGKVGNITDLSRLGPRQGGETTIVHWMHHCLYDVTGSDLGTLSLLKILRPKLITIVEQDLSHGGNFLGRFIEALHYYSALFDSLGDGLSEDSIDRHQVEQQLFGMEIRNIVAVGGPKRTGEVKVDRWGDELRRIGFKSVSLGGNPAAQANLLLGMFPWKGYTLVEDEETGSLKLGWKDLSLLTASAWQLLD
ncbi:hypothetical protein MKW98_013355 [Papaver atlanticum]|uniref:Scarecrow-like protein 23 n=1 Tax=Papaver atlanticum TaxID=357466 RepID=A0AAD4SSM1_9MAGN|nr:hypothetical protein MKW98_013355 [Papaver atlanticum]